MNARPILLLIAVLSLQSPSAAQTPEGSASNTNLGGNNVIRGRAIDGATQSAVSGLIVEFARGDLKAGQAFQPTLLDTEHTQDDGTFLFVGGPLPKGPYTIRIRNQNGTYGNIVPLDINFDGAHELGKITTGPQAVGKTAAPYGTYAERTLWYVTDRQHSGNSFTGDPDPSSQVFSGTVLASVGIRGTTAVPNGWKSSTGDGSGDEALARRVSSPQTGAPQAAQRIVSSARANHHLHVVVYVHGYGTAFPEAVKQGAHVALLLSSVPAEVVVYSWPSAGDRTAYSGDAERARAGAVHFGAFLATLQRAAPDLRIDVVAHSMGNRVLTEALNLASVHLARKLDTTIMAAADVDIPFVNNNFSSIAPYLGRRLTISSTLDKALEFSKCVNHNQRLGLTLRNAAAGPIRDATNDAPRTDFGHFYFINSRAVAQLEASFLAAGQPRPNLFQTLDWLGDKNTVPSWWDTIKETGEQKICKLIFH